jgi:hypothetical protein
MEIPAEGVRLNVGCGRHVLDGWVNADAVASKLAPRPPELLCDVSDIPLPAGSVRELMGIHIWEHLYRWQCDVVIAHWRRLMRPGALLVLEMPDLFKFCKNILEAKAGRRHPDQLGMWGLYGDPTEKDPYMAHRWGWTFSTLAPFLESHGFGQCAEGEPQWHAVGRHDRDFRITARRV